MRNDIERLEQEIRAVKEVLALGEEQEENPGNPPHPTRQGQVEFYLRRANLEHLIHVSNDQLRDHLERLERDLEHAQLNGWSE